MSSGVDVMPNPSPGLKTKAMLCHRQLGSPRRFLQPTSVLLSKDVTPPFPGAAGIEDCGDGHQDAATEDEAADQT